MTDGAGRTTFAEIDDESRTPVLLPLDLDHVHRIGSDLPEGHKLRRTSRVAHEALLRHQGIEALFDFMAQFSCAAHAVVLKRTNYCLYHFLPSFVIRTKYARHAPRNDWLNHFDSSSTSSDSGTRAACSRILA